MGFLILVGVLALAACDESISLQGNGDLVTETRNVSDFDALRANNGVHVVITVDSTATGDVALEVTTDSNLQEFLTTKVSGNKLTVSSNRFGGVTPTGGFDVLGSVAAIDDVSVDNGARVEITGSAGNVTLSANNGAQLDAGAFEAATVEVDADNGAQMTVCATEEVSGEVTNGANLTVLCGGSMRVNSSDGGSVSSSP
jgi:hypothetical protein